MKRQVGVVNWRIEHLDSRKIEKALKESVQHCWAQCFYVCGVVCTGLGRSRERSTRSVNRCRAQVGSRVKRIRPILLGPILRGRRVQADGLENEFGLQRFLAKPADLGQVVTGKVLRNLITEPDSWKMAPDRDKNRPQVLVKPDQAVLRVNVAWRRVSPVARVIHLKGYVLNGFLAGHHCPTFTALFSNHGLPGAASERVGQL